MRSWFAPVITQMVQDWLINNPEYRAGQENAKATGDWMNHLIWSTQKSTELYDAIYWALDKYLNVFQMRLVKLFLFGRYKYSYKTMAQELMGEWITQDTSKLRYVFSKDGFTRFDDGQPRQFSYQIRVTRDRYLSLDTIYLPNNSAATATLYFFDDCRSLEYRSGSYTVIWRRNAA